MADLAGRVALVTGGSRGIGAAIARRLARDGADVAITYVSAPDKAKAVVDEITSMGRRALAIAADAADAAAMSAAVARAAVELGRLDILVNNAGIAVVGAPEAMRLEDFDRTMAINARAAFVATQAALKHLERGGRIINIGSCLAEMPSAGTSVYAMSKAALVGLTKGLARDLGPRGITVNIVHPGPIDTDMNPANGPDADAQRQQVALGRFGEGVDIAATVAHLAGEGGRYITGTAVAVDGGYGG